LAAGRIPACRRPRSTVARHSLAAYRRAERPSLPLCRGAESFTGGIERKGLPQDFRRRRWLARGGDSLRMAEQDESQTRESDERLLQLPTPQTGSPARPDATRTARCSLAVAPGLDRQERF
jgi:hypothetical protein